MNEDRVLYCGQESTIELNWESSLCCILKCLNVALGRIKDGTFYLSKTNEIYCYNFAVGSF